MHPSSMIFTRTSLTTLAALGLLSMAALLSPAAVEGQRPTPDTSPTREAPSFTPFTVAPSLLNTDEVVETVERAYPSALREAGIGGRVNVWFFLDATGQVDNTLLNESSGNAQLDEAAMSVAQVLRFSPAMNRENRVPVWIALPITFEPEESR